MFHLRERKHALFCRGHSFYWTVSVPFVNHVKMEWKLIQIQFIIMYLRINKARTIWTINLIVKMLEDDADEEKIELIKNTRRCSRWRRKERHSRFSFHFVIQIFLWWYQSLSCCTLFSRTEFIRDKRERKMSKLFMQTRDFPGLNRNWILYLATIFVNSLALSHSSSGFLPLFLCLPSTRRQQTTTKLKPKLIKHKLSTCFRARKLATV